MAGATVLKPTAAHRRLGPPEGGNAIASYLQLGHASHNLVREVGLDGFSGVVLSPVNYTPDETTSRVIASVGERPLDVVFDPQLYNPTSNHAKLNAWHYFPSGFDTTDMGDLAAWQEISTNLAEDAASVGATAVCSPVGLPGQFSDEYYSFCNQVFQSLRDCVSTSDARVLLTVVVDGIGIAQPDGAERLASILIQAKAVGVYLVLLSDVAPRRELGKSEMLRGVMMLIYYLRQAGTSVLMSHAGSEHVLWRVAGATACSTGKFFNLRRFSRSRFEDADDQGRGAFPYWFEEGLLAFLRDADVARLRREKPDLIGTGASLNPYGLQILHHLDATPSQSWLALAWRHYLRWFIDSGDALENGGLPYAKALVERAEGRWQELESEGLHLMEERANDGSWIRPWRISLSDFERSLTRRR